jgi:ubiquinol-cytochrome c reductase cytochrome c subunit
MLRAPAAVVLAAAGACAVLGLSSPATSQGDDGRLLYQRDCSFCHGVGGEGTNRGPSLTGTGGAGADFMLSTGRMPVSDPSDPLERRSPRYDQAGIAALTRYVAGLGTGPAVPDVHPGSSDLAAGGEIYRVNCAVCHSSTGEGGALIGAEHAPPLGPATHTQVAEAMLVGPGTMPKFTQFTPAQVDSIVAYVDYIHSPDDRGGLGLLHLGPVAEGAVALGVGLVALMLVTRWIGIRE